MYMFYRNVSGIAKGLFSNISEKHPLQQAEQFVTLAFSNMDKGGDGEISYAEFEKIAFMQPFIFKFFFLGETVNLDAEALEAENSEHRSKVKVYIYVWYVDSA